MLENPHYRAFLEKAKQVAQEARTWFSSGKILKCFSHIDADGLSAASILTKALFRASIPFEMRTLKQIAVDSIREIARDSTPEKNILIFTDFGTGQKSLLLDKLTGFQIIILDHHKPPGVKEGQLAQEPITQFPEILELNPHGFEINGGEEVSGAGVTYFFCTQLDPKNKDLAPLGVVGAVGDRQDKGENFQLTGLNRLILEDGLKEGLISEFMGIRVFGRETRPLATALANTMYPFFPGLSGNETACANFFNQIKVQLEKPDRTPRTFADLDDQEVKDVMSNLTSLGIVQYGMNPEQIGEFIGTIYAFPGEPPGSYTRDAREFAFLLNSCGRLGHAGLGIAVGTGARGKTLERAEQVITDYRRTLSTSMDMISREHLLKQKDNIQFFYGRDLIPEKVIGTVASLVLSSPSADKNKIIIGLADSNGELLKVSLRGPTHLIEHEKLNPTGINLARIMHEATDRFKLENPAGGHAAACGAYIPKTIMDSFLKFVDDYIQDQFASDKL